MKSALGFYQHFQHALLECDGVIEAALRCYLPVESVPKPADTIESEIKKKTSKNTPAFDVSSLAYQYFRTDLFAISGISHNTVLCLLTTLGKDIYYNAPQNLDR